jgi:hypothetical protein
MLSEKTARMGDKAKPLAAYRPTALLYWKDRREQFRTSRKGQRGAGVRASFRSAPLYPTRLRPTL